MFQPAKESIGKRLFRKMKRNAKIDRNENRFENFQDQIEKETLSFEPKVNLHGLGYNEMLDAQQFLYSETKTKPKDDYVAATLSGGRRLKISGEAFGYGALEDEDPLSIYNTDDMSQYDFEIGSLPRKVSEPKRKFPSTTGAIELEGFAKTKSKASIFISIKTKFRPPELPKGWRPKRIVRKVDKKSRWDNGESRTPEVKKQPTLNANLRAVILGEEVVHKIGVAKSRPQEPTQLSFEKEVNKPKPTTTVIEVKSSPLTGFFASKFTRSSTSKSSEDESISAGLTTFAELSAIADTNVKPAKDKEDSELEAKNPIRTVFEWHPHKLVCRRFAAQNPYPLFTDIVGIIAMDDKQRNATSRINKQQPLDTKKSLFTSLFQDLDQMNRFTPSVSKETQLNQTISPKTISPPAKVEVIDVDQESDEESKPERPPMDLFKSIFASDDEEEEEEEEAKVVEKTLDVSKTEESNNSLLKSEGIFSGIDFDDLNQNFNPCFVKKNETVSNDTEVEEIIEDDDDDCYGPALPPGPLSQVSKTKPDQSKKSKRKEKKSKKKRKEKKKQKREHRKRKHSEKIEQKLIDLIKKARYN